MRRFSAIAFYRPLLLILALDLMYQQNNDNRLYSKEDSPSSNTLITPLLSVLPLLVIDDFQNMSFPGAKKIETNLFRGFLNLLKSY